MVASKAASRASRRRPKPEHIRPRNIVRSARIELSVRVVVSPITGKILAAKAAVDYFSPSAPSTFVKTSDRDALRREVSPVRNGRRKRGRVASNGKVRTHRIRTKR